MRAFLIVFLVGTCMQYAAAALSTFEQQRPHDGYRLQGDALYKVHAQPRAWNEAYQYCTLEDAALLYPRNASEAKLALDLLQEKFPRGAESWIGAHGLFTPTNFVDLEGVEISNYFAPWGRNTPNRRGLFETCVVIRPDGSIADQQCSSWKPFVCKKAVNNNITYNSECDTYDAAYKRNGESAHCYKIHKEPRTWVSAYLTCDAEKGYLAIADDKDEADFIVSQVKPLLEEIPGNYNKTLIAVGIHDKFEEGIFMTIKGKSVNTVYNKWAAGQPDDEFGSDDCGALSVEGELHDMGCERQRTLFVCEREISGRS